MIRRLTGAIDPVSIARLMPVVLATWFVLIAALRIGVLRTTGAGFDGKLYRSATAAWLSGGDPWNVSLNGVYYAAPPPSLLPFIPLTWLSEDVAIAILIALGVVANVYMIRRLRLPLWWLAFPPLVDGIWNANVHVLIAPLIVAGLGPVASLLKVYALVPPFIQGRWRATVASVALLLATIPLLPWRQFVGELPGILNQLAIQSRGGLSVTAFPPIIAIAMAFTAVAAIIYVGRERGSWFAVPVLWPSTQWYYSSIAIPGATAISAFILAIPIEGGAFVALMAVATELAIRRSRASKRPAVPSAN